MVSPDNPFKNKHFGQSLKCAYQGLAQAIKSEKNLKTHFILALLAFIAALFCDFKPLEWAVLLLTIGLVIFSELMNTAIEAVIDLVVEDKWHPLAKMAKDIAAAAVLVTAIISLLVGCFLFIPHLFTFITH